ncbi:hypothetical protein A2U01_0038567 [Trifolium medium]|uniref:Uncharacterized protein n=1 Tax=Trifolium medium TaxID=97028 RepID=A0A392Q131_9FABA|nr:hypothetical protein [Trifolium medium]
MRYGILYMESESVVFPCSCRVAANSHAAAFHVTCYASGVVSARTNQSSMILNF